MIPELLDLIMDGLEEVDKLKKSGLTESDVLDMIDIEMVSPSEGKE